MENEPIVNNNEEYNQEYSQSENEVLMGNNLCRKCEQNYIDTSESRHSILCTKCREEQINYPIPKFLWVAGIALVALTISAFTSFPQDFKDYVVYANAEKKADSGIIDDTLMELEELAKKHDKWHDPAERITDIAMKNGRYDYASYVIDEYLAEKDIDKDVYDKEMKYIATIDKYYDTREMMSSIVKDASKYEDYSEYKKYMNSKLNTMLKESKYSKSLIYYYLSMFTDDIHQSEDYLNKSIDADKALQSPKIDLANLYRITNRIDEAKKSFEDILRKDSDSPEALSGLAVINMIEKNYDEAVKNAQAACDKDDEKEHILETLMIALYADDQKDELEKVKQAYLDNGFTLDWETIEVLNGTMTLETYYIYEKGEE